MGAVVDDITKRFFDNLKSASIGTFGKWKTTTTTSTKTTTTINNNKDDNNNNNNNKNDNDNSNNKVSFLVPDEDDKILQSSMSQQSVLNDEDVIIHPQSTTLSSSSSSLLPLLPSSSPPPLLPSPPPSRNNSKNNNNHETMNGSGGYADFIFRHAAFQLFGYDLPSNMPLPWMKMGSGGIGSSGGVGNVGGGGGGAVAVDTIRRCQQQQQVEEHQSTKTSSSGNMDNNTIIPSPPPPPPPKRATSVAVRRRGRRRNASDLFELTLYRNRMDGTCSCYPPHPDEMMEDDDGKVGSNNSSSNGTSTNSSTSTTGDGRKWQSVLRFAAAYGFKNVQLAMRNLDGKGKGGIGGSGSSAASNSGTYHYVEIMACPSGGCVNGGGQIQRTKKGAGVDGRAEHETPSQRRERVGRIRMAMDALINKTAMMDIHESLTKEGEKIYNKLLDYGEDNNKEEDEPGIGKVLTKGMTMNTMYEKLHSMHILNTRFHAVPKLELAGVGATAGVALDDIKMVL